MGWFTRDRRGISWRDQTLESISPPPAPLIVFFGLFMLLMFLASYSDYKAQMEKAKIGARLFLLLVPFLLILVVYVMMANRWFIRRQLASPARDEGGSPWGLALWVVLLLVMVHYQSSFQSSWFRTF